MTFSRNFQYLDLLVIQIKLFLGLFFGILSCFSDG